MPPATDKHIDAQKVADLFREYKRLTYERADQDARVSALTPAEREHYYDLIRADSRRVVDR